MIDSDAVSGRIEMRELKKGRVSAVNYRYDHIKEGYKVGTVWV